MWTALQHRLGQRVFDETGESLRFIKWRDYLYSSDRDALLRNLAKQTGLTFRREPREMTVWAMVEDKR